jgi:hypothetical protein
MTLDNRSAQRYTIENGTRQQHERSENVSRRNV